ncbi:hypothetical protein JOM56_010134 [Amanita muscaria]
MRLTLVAVTSLLPLLAFSAPANEHHGFCNHHTYDALNCLKVRDVLGCLTVQGVVLGSQSIRRRRRLRTVVLIGGLRDVLKDDILRENRAKNKVPEEVSLCQVLCSVTRVRMSSNTPVLSRLAPNVNMWSGAIHIWQQHP